MFRNLKSLLRYFPRYTKHFLTGLSALTVVNLADVSLPLIVGYAINHLKEREIVIYCALIYMGVALVQNTLRYWMRLGFYGLSYHVARDIRNDLFTHLQKLSVNFFNTTKTGDIMSRSTNDIEAVRSFYQFGLFIGIDIILYLIYVPFALVYLSPRLALYTVLPLLPLPFIVNRFSNVIHKRFKVIQESLSDISARASENFSGIRVIKSFVLEAKEIGAFRLLNLNYFKKNLHLNKIEALLGPLMTLTIGIARLVIVVLGGLDCINGNIELGTLISYLLLLDKIAWPMMGMGMIMSHFQRAGASMDRLQEIFRTKPEITEPEKPASYAIAKGEIEFAGVGFEYPTAPDIFKKDSTSKQPFSLTDVNLKIPAGSAVLVMGPIGSGKSTMANLLVRFLDPAKGQIMIDGVDIKHYPLSHLRRAIGFVPQDTFLFADSIRENILFGVTNQSQHDVTGPLRIVQMNETIMQLPDKYESLLGERGVNLSGGQKQRLTLARAIIKEPTILIMDDCFSSVDFETEQAILNELKNVLKNRTTLIISHRLAAVKLAHFILFMEDGRVVENGTHEELVAKQGHYARFYEYQKLKEALEEA